MVSNLLSNDPYPIPLILDRDKLPKINVVIGSDDEQLRFFKKEYFKITGNVPTICKQTEKITDDILYKDEDNTILVINSESYLEISQDVFKKIGVWSNTPVTKRSSAINCIIKKAYSITHPGKKLDKNMVNPIGDYILYRDRDDIENMLWEAIALITNGEDLSQKKEYKDVWDSPYKWLKPGDNVTQKLNYLYMTFLWYTYSRTDEWQKAKSTGCSPSKFQWLKSINFNNYDVLKSVELLSQWKNGTKKSYQVLAELGIIWSGD